MEEPKTPRPRSVGSARPRPRKLPKESYEGFNDMANEGFVCMDVQHRHADSVWKQGVA